MMHRPGEHFIVMSVTRTKLFLFSKGGSCLGRNKAKRSTSLGVTPHQLPHRPAPPMLYQRRSDQTPRTNVPFFCVKFAIGTAGGKKPQALDKNNFYGSQIRAKESFPERRLLRVLEIVLVKASSNLDSDPRVLQIQEALESSFSQPFVGNAADGFRSHLERLEDTMQRQDFSQPGSYYSRSLAIIQSSGSGTSRLLQELQNLSNWFVISLCLRSTQDQGQSGFSLGDASVYDFLFLGTCR